MANTKKVRKAIIPAAGFGTRFLPATKAQTKEMLRKQLAGLAIAGAEKIIKRNLDATTNAAWHEVYFLFLPYLLLDS